MDLTPELIEESSRSAVVQQTVDLEPHLELSIDDLSLARSQHALELAVTSLAAARVAAAIVVS